MLTSASVAHRGRSRSRVTSGLAAAAVIAVAGGAWLLVGPPAPDRIPAGGPAGVALTTNPGTHSKTNSPDQEGSTAAKQANSDADPKVTGSPAQPDGQRYLLTSPAAIQLLTSALGVSPDKAAAAARELDRIAAANNGGLDPESSAFAAVAAGLGVTGDQLRHALDRIKLAADPSVGASGTKSPPPSAAIKTGSGVADGDRQDLLGSPEAVHMLASILRVSEDKATAAAQQLSALADNGGGLDPGSDGFAAVARSLGVTSSQLTDAIDRIKKSG